MTEIIYLESFKKHKFQEDVVKRIKIALPFFPELKLVYVGLTSNKQCLAQANFDNNIVMYRPDVSPTNVTTFHELMHLVAWLKDETPKTEEYCSVYAMARMTKDLVDADIPYIHKGDRELWQIPAICRHVVKAREAGYRSYLQLYRGLIGWLPHEHLYRSPSRELLDDEIKTTFGINPELSDDEVIRELEIIL